MNSLHRKSIVQVAPAWLGLFAAATAIVLPVSAQDKPKPETSSPLQPPAELTAPESPNAQSPAPAVPTASASGTIVEVASASDSFQTLVAALTEAELTQVLQGAGPFTVFAPTDEAFAALPAGSVEKLLQPENRAMLVQLLKYHVVSGSYPAASLSSGEVPTVEGQPITVTVGGGTVQVNEATVIQADIPATNGVIHAIDRVIIPPGM